MPVSAKISTPLVHQAPSAVLPKSRLESVQTNINGVKFKPSIFTLASGSKTKHSFLLPNQYTTFSILIIIIV
jgi:hypothetical protein